MSDRPNTPDQSGTSAADQSGGWRQPSGATQGGWRVPERTPESPAPQAAPAPEERSESSWRPAAVPRSLSATPQTAGGWHRPPQTTLDVEAEAPVQEVPAEDSESLIPHDEGGEAEAVTPAPDVLPFDEAAAEAEAAAHALDLIDEDDDESLSMSELFALASLADQQRAPAAGETGAAVVDDPAAYAREQLARLQALQQGDTSAGESTADQPAVTEDEESQAAAYAREQLAKLTDSQKLAAAVEAGTVGVQPAPAAPVITMTPEEIALAQRYHDAENAIRTLRAQFRAGQITSDQLQNELRRHLVLDEQQRWWMMGTESDMWYRHDNGQWIVDTPSVLLKEAEGGAPAALTGATGASLPYLVEEAARQRDVSQSIPEGATVATSTIRPEDMQLPRPTSVSDLEATIPGTQGIYLGEQDPNQTVVANPYGQETVASGVTMPNARYDSVEAPIPVPSAPPNYDVDMMTPTYEAARDEQRAQTFRTIGIVTAVVAALLFLIAAGAIILGVVTYNNIAAPWQDEIAALADYRPTTQTAYIYAADGRTVIAELASGSGGARQRIDLAEISPELIHAIVSVENERFFADPGFDPIAIARAFIQNLQAGGIESGASTITQQIARNLVMRDFTATADRKLTEIVIAAEIAQRYDKNFILELYLNEIFLGNQSYGVETAAQLYFDKPAADLNLAESALIAGLIQAPAAYDPVTNPDAAEQRMFQVLNMQVAVGCLQFQHAPYATQPFCVTREVLDGPLTAVDIARVQVRVFTPRSYDVEYPHFVNYVQAIVERQFGSPEEIFRRGMRITTTLNPAIQDLTESALRVAVSQLAPNAVNTGAILVTDPRSGAILAMVGSPDYTNDSTAGQVNNVFTWQQPGSTIKPILYTAALEGINRNGALEYYTPATILWDVPVQYETIPPYSPVNFDGIFRGPMALRYALQGSINVPAVKSLEWMGLDEFRETATRMGVRFLDEATFGLPTALGATEVRLYDMVQAYGTLADNGERVPLYGIQSIIDSDGVDITPVSLRGAAEQVVTPQIAYLMNSMLTDNDARAPIFGVNNGLWFPAYPGRVAAKTGTTDNRRDLWTIGYSNNFVVGVWLGRHDDGATQNTTQGSAIPVWNAVMSALLQAAAPAGWNAPDGIVQQQICADTGTLYDPNIQPCRSVRTELFWINQMPPPAGSGFVQDLQIDTWTRLRANQYCPESVTTERFLAISDASAIRWLTTTNEGRAYAQANSLPTNAPPTGECAVGQIIPQVGLSAPTDGATVTETVSFVGTVQADQFNRYQIEIAPVGSNEYRIIAGPYATQGQNIELGRWDSRNVTNGQYVVRLAVFSNQGGFIYRTITILINNIPPTPTLTPTPTQTLIPTFPAFTPLPFDTPIPFGAQGLATMTPQNFVPMGGLSTLAATPTPEF